MNTPQIIYLTITAVGLLIEANQHGKPKGPGNHNFWVTAVSTAICLSILYWGGFFTN